MRAGGLYFGLSVVLIVCLVQHGVNAKPYQRVKRVSDQRLAELETLVALSKMSGKLVTVPLAYGKVDPKFIGRKRRSDRRLLDDLFSRSFSSTSEEDSAEADPPENNYDDLLYR